MTSKTSAEKSYIDRDAEALELDEARFVKALGGMPKLPNELCRQRITILLDLYVINHFKGGRRLANPD